MKKYQSPYQLVLFYQHSFFEFRASKFKLLTHSYMCFQYNMKNTIWQSRGKFDRSLDGMAKKREEIFVVETFTEFSLRLRQEAFG